MGAALNDEHLGRKDGHHNIEGPDSGCWTSERTVRRALLTELCDWLDTKLPTETMKSLVVTTLRYGVLLTSMRGLSGINLYESSCETLPSKIHLSKEEYNQGKELERTCEEDVSLNKCEGTCVSGIKPSAIDRSGFSKECHCCRETSYRDRVITLSNCYNEGGHKLTGPMGSMQVTIKEPDGCSCHECGKSFST